MAGNVSIEDSVDISRIQLLESGAPATPASGLGRLYATPDGRLHYLNAAAVDIELQAAPNSLGPWGDAPDNDLVFAAQAVSGGNLWYVTGNQMRNDLYYPVTADIGAFLTTGTHFILNSNTDRTVTFSSALPSQWFHAYAIQVSGGTGHKLLLPANTYFGSSGTNRAAIFNAVDDCLMVRAFDAGGGITRFLVYINTGVTFAAS